MAVDENEDSSERSQERQVKAEDRKVEDRRLEARHEQKGGG